MSGNESPKLENVSLGVNVAPHSKGGHSPLHRPLLHLLVDRLKHLEKKYAHDALIDDDGDVDYLVPVSLILPILVLLHLMPKLVQGLSSQSFLQSRAKTSKSCQNLSRARPLSRFFKVD